MPNEADNVIAAIKGSMMLFRLILIRPQVEFAIRSIDALLGVVPDPVDDDPDNRSFSGICGKTALLIL